MGYVPQQPPEQSGIFYRSDEFYKTSRKSSARLQSWTNVLNQVGTLVRSAYRIIFQIIIFGLSLVAAWFFFVHKNPLVIIEEFYKFFIKRFEEPLYVLLAGILVISIAAVKIFRAKYHRIP